MKDQHSLHGAKHAQDQQMKAADARRHDQLQKKRLRQTESHDEHDDARCYLADRLLSAYETDRGASPAQASLTSIEDEIMRQETALGTLDELKRWTERFVDVQMMWVDCSARLDAGAALRVWNRMDRLMRRVAQQPNASEQLALFHAQLPALVAEAAALVTQQQLRGLDPAAASPGPPLGDAVSLRAQVVLPHQWLPRVLRDICNSVEREYTAAHCRPSLVDATRKILQVVRDRNPYAFLSILYRPPPLSEDGDTHAFVLYASPQTDAIARLLHTDFELLRDFGWWMEKPDASFWKTFARLMHCVRRLAVAFHHVMVHLYATAMQRQDARVTSDDVAQQIEASLAARASFTLQSEGYGLASWFATASDAIFHETYVMFPEVLVYVDAWRREFTVYEHGFAPAERARDYEVGYHKWKSSKTWLEIAQQAKRAAQAWRRSRLGSHIFQPLSIQQLGKLETDIKLRFGKITDLLYKQNLAKWSQQRYQHSRARVLGELQIMADDTGIQTSDVTKGVEANRTPLVAPSLSEAPSIKQKTFRLPTLSRPMSAAITKDVRSNGNDAGVSPIDEEAILKWTDDEIDAHEQATERLYELQGGMLSASDALSLSQLVAPELGGDGLFDVVDEQTGVSGLYANCRKLRGLTHRVVARGDEIALHSAAEALIQRPSLRTATDDRENARDDREAQRETTEASSPTETLEVAIRDSAVRFLNLHQVAATDPDAQESAQKLALEALALLRRAQGQTPI